MHLGMHAHTHTHTTKNSQDASQYIMPVMGHGVLVFLFYGSKGIGYWFHVMTSEMPTF